MREGCWSFEDICVFLWELVGVIDGFGCCRRVEEWEGRIENVGQGKGCRVRCQGVLWMVFSVSVLEVRGDILTSET